jgi:hypothetical protein
MKRKIIGIVVCLLVIATAIPTVASLDDSVITSLEKNSITHSIKQITTPAMGEGNVIFSQPPHSPDDVWSAFTSASSFPHLCQEDFWGLTASIDGVHWWGLTLIWNSGWYVGNPDGMKFEIKFYQDSAGVPGSVVATFSDIVPTYVNTGLNYAGYPLSYFETDIPGVSLANGWISIQSTYSPDNSSLLWMSSPEGNLNAIQNGIPQAWNLAFELNHTSPDATVSIAGGLGVNLQITNIGTTDVNDIAWQIQVAGGILGKINKTVNGTVDIPAGETKTVSTGIFFGFGAIAITAKVDDKEETAIGTQLIIFSILNK